MAIHERENNATVQRMMDGEKLANHRPLYVSPACEMDEALMTHINGEQVLVLGAWDRAERRSVVTAVGNDRSTETI